jgi:hypothetical protein
VEEGGLDTVLLGLDGSPWAQEGPHEHRQAHHCCHKDHQSALHCACLGNDHAGAVEGYLNAEEELRIEARWDNFQEVVEGIAEIVVVDDLIRRNSGAGYLRMGVAEGCAGD